MQSQLACDVIEREVIEQKQAQRYGEQVEKRVVSGEKDQNLQEQDGCGPEEAPDARREKQKRHPKLDEQGEGGRKTLDAERQLVHVPGERGGQRLRQVVVGQSRPIAPDRIMT